MSHHVSFFSRRFLVGALFVALAGILQSIGAASVSGVRPNLLLVVLATLAFFFEDVIIYIGLVSVGLVFIGSEAGFTSPSVALGVIAVSIFFLKARLPGNQLINTAIVITLGTFLTYVLSDLTFLGNDPFTVAVEVIYNVLVGIPVYFIVLQCIGYETKFRASR